MNSEARWAYTMNSTDATFRFEPDDFKFAPDDFQVLYQWKRKAMIFPSQGPYVSIAAQFVSVNKCFKQSLQTAGLSVCMTYANVDVLFYAHVDIDFEFFSYHSICKPSFSNLNLDFNYFVLSMALSLLNAFYLRE